MQTQDGERLDVHRTHEGGERVAKRLKIGNLELDAIGNSNSAFIAFDENAPTDTPATGTVHLYAKADNILYTRDELGVEAAVGAGAPGVGDVTGPSSSTDNSIARFNGTDNKTLQGSGVIIDDSDNLTLPAGLTMSSTTDGLLPPRMTTLQRDLITPSTGMIIYNTTTNFLETYDGTEWVMYNVLGKTVTPATTAINTFLTSPVLPSGYTASCPDENASFPAWQAFDNDPATRFQTQVSPDVFDDTLSPAPYLEASSTTVDGSPISGMILEYTIPAAKRLSNYVINCSGINPSTRSPTTFIIAGYSEYGTWVELDSRTNVWGDSGTPDASTSKSYTCTSFDLVTKVRLIVTHINNATVNQNTLQIQSFDLYWFDADYTENIIDATQYKENGTEGVIARSNVDSSTGGFIINSNADTDYTGIGNNNILIGNDVGVEQVSSGSTFVGNACGRYTSGNFNVAYGANALTGVSGGTTVGEMTAIGNGALDSVITGSVGNTALGSTAGSGTSGGSYCTFVGTNAGSVSNASGDYNTMVGYNSEVLANADNQLSLGNGATCTVANEAVIGNAALTHIRPMGTCDLGTTGNKFADAYLSGDVSAATLTLATTYTTWEPTVGNGTTSYTLTTNDCYYYDVGAIRYIFCDLLISNLNSATGGVTQFTLPSAAKTSSGFTPGGSITLGICSYFTFTGQIVAKLENASSDVLFYDMVSAGGVSAITAEKVASNTRINLSGYYYI